MSDRDPEPRRGASRPCIDLENSGGDYTPLLDPTRVPTERREFFEELPQPQSGSLENGDEWNSIALFFNLPSSNQPNSYTETTEAAAKKWLEEGEDPMSPTISEFMKNYWKTLSYGKFAFGIDTPRGDDGNPLIPTITAQNVSPGSWGQLVNRCIDANPEAIWKAAGELKKDDKRWIPSVVLVQNYNVQASANFGGYDRTVDGTTYRIGDRTHIEYGFERHATEQIGYVAIGTPTGNGTDLTEDGVTESWSTVNFENSYSTKPVVVGSIQSFNGSDPAGIRMDNRLSGSIDVRIEEEQSFHTETTHKEESVGYFAFSPGPITDESGSQIGEAGTIETDQSARGDWHEVNLDQYYSDPVVLAQLLTQNGSHPSHIRLRHVGNRSFDFQIEEWNYLDQSHKSETIGYVVLTRGSHELADGTVLEVDTVRTDHTWTTQSLPMSGHQDAVVLSRTQTRNGKQAVITRQNNVDETGFDVRLQEEERNHRSFWGTLAHEYGHNFLQFRDLYGPEGATLYWDLLGDESYPADMSEVSSAHKARVGWLDFNETIEGSPSSGYTNQFNLKPYTTSGDALKVIPDPENNPYEYFVIEYRGPTGDEPWRPSGGLTEEGLLITHFNVRTKDSNEHESWFMSEAPYFDPEFADYRDEGGALRGSGHTGGALFTGESGRDKFGPDTEPSSDFYGGRSSTLVVDDISVEDDTASFWLSLEPIEHERVWTTSSADRGIAGQYTDDDPEARDEIFFRNDDEVALLTHSETKWFVRSHQSGKIDDWNLGSGDWEQAADVDDDGRDEVYIRSDNHAGILQWNTERFELKGLAQGSIDEWNLGSGDWECVGDLDGDGSDEIYIRSEDWAGIIEWTDELSLKTITQATVGNWQLGGADTERLGNFTGSGTLEIAVVGDYGLGLLAFDQDTGSLKSIAVQTGSVDEWSLDPDDEIYAGDFDGDGQDELYLRKDNQAAILQWESDGFAEGWQRQDNIQGLQNPNNTLALTGNDRSYIGQFLPSTDGGRHRDAIFHVVDDRVSLLSYDDDSKELRVENFENGEWFTWEGETKLILGDFHRVGPETATNDQFIADEGTDAFLHNKWGTATMGVDIYIKEKAGADTRRPSVFWPQEEYLVSKYKPALIAGEKNDEPIDPETDLKFFGVPRGVADADNWTIEWAYQDPNNNWHSIGTSDPGKVHMYDGLPDQDTGAGTDGWEIVQCRARATNGSQTLTEHFTIQFESTGPLLYESHSVAMNSGTLSNNGAVEKVTETDTLRVGDDAENNSLQAMLTFELDLPDSVSPSDIEEATLELVLQPPVGDPSDDLLELSVIQADYGETIESSDFRTDSLTILPGQSIVNYQDGFGGRSVDVTTAVRHAWEHRDSRDNRIQFVIYHHQATDEDSTADYLRLAAEDPDVSSHNSLLRVRYNSGDE